MTLVNPPRYAEERWKLVIGRYEGIEQAAVNELQKTIQDLLPYVLEVCSSQVMDAPEPGVNMIVSGCLDSNPRLGQVLSESQLPSPSVSQGYTLACSASPWNRDDRMLLVAGYDARGMLYGAQELSRKLYTQGQTVQWRQALQQNANARLLDSLPEFTLHDAPRMAKRGIWTWGYVVYDYRRFIDNMARLKMNWWIVWNDVPPINAPQVIDYAHQHGVEIVFGYAWGWGLSGLNLADPADRRRIMDSAVETYRRQYADLDHDGIYFQTLTEHHDTRIGGMSVAGLTCQLVNETAAELYRIDPDLRIYFGLHATSIQADYPDLSNLDSRVIIAWEDAGGIPYLYEPGFPPDRTPEAALDYSRHLAAIRPGVPFALVPKGWSNLDWQNEFEHHGPYILGERSGGFTSQRMKEKQPLWNWRNALWDRYFPLAIRFYREMLLAAPGGVWAAGLLEDGLFEETIQPSVALFAEMMWNPEREDDEILHHALEQRTGDKG